MAVHGRWISARRPGAGRGKEPIDVQDVHVLLSRLFLRPEARGIFISASGYTQPAHEIQRQAASQKVLLLCDLAEIVQILEREEGIDRFFKDKTDHAITELSSSASAR